MNEIKFWILIILTIITLYDSSSSGAGELVPYFWWIFLGFFVVHIFTLVRHYLKYKNKLESFREEVLLNANEKWDFLYQDVWVPFVFVFLVLFFVLLDCNKENLIYFILILELIEIVFNKIILRNKLIIEEDKMSYSDKAVFSEIEFGEIKSVVFDDNMGKINIAFFEKFFPENNAVLEEDILDTDDEGLYSYERKEFLRRGLFLEDWKRIGEILNEKSKVFRFELDIIEAVKVKY